MRHRGRVYGYKRGDTTKMIPVIPFSRGLGHVFHISALSGGNRGVRDVVEKEKPSENARFSSVC